VSLLNSGGVLLEDASVKSEERLTGKVESEKRPSMNGLDLVSFLHVTVHHVSAPCACRLAWSDASWRSVVQA
jgi:hypothetical protein